MSLYGTQTTVVVSGSMEFTGGCETGTCPISFSSIKLSVGSFSGTFGGVTYAVTGTKVVNVGPIAGTSLSLSGAVVSPCIAPGSVGVVFSVVDSHGVAVASASTKVYVSA